MRKILLDYRGDANTDLEATARILREPRPELHATKRIVDLIGYGTAEFTLHFDDTTPFTGQHVLDRFLALLAASQVPNGINPFLRSGFLWLTGGVAHLFVSRRGHGLHDRLDPENVGPFGGNVLFDDDFLGRMEW